VFGFPGIGRLLLDGIVQRDFAIVQSVVLVAALAIMIMNLLIDLLYVAIDPRVRHS
jgi:peptide/nickel transport system permease protein